MKRFFGFLVVLLLFCGCDDGDMQVESFDFTNVSSAKCGTGIDDFFIYKVSGNEALIIQLDENTFKNKVTTAGTVQTLDINGTTVKVIYRLYNGPIAGSDLCTTIPPSFPVVEDEWNATGGTLEIVTNVSRELDEDTGSNFIKGFSHTITFRNIRFDVGDGRTQTNEVLNFGTYLVATDNVSDFNSIDIKNCGTEPFLFKYSETQAIQLKFTPEDFAALFANVPTTDTPRTLALNANNFVTYGVYASTLSQSLFCDNTLPGIKNDQFWISKASASANDGIIEVTTTTLGDNYQHTITLKNVTFQNPNDVGQDFTFGTSYVLGTFVTN